MTEQQSNCLCFLISAVIGVDNLKFGDEMIDTGDTVLHLPTGEEFTVACVIGDKLSWCGWPEGQAELSDIRLIKVASDDSRYDLLHEIASISGNDHRKRYAQKRLKEMREL